MKRVVLCNIICGVLLLVSPLRAAVLFSDNYNRTDNTDIDASSVGMAGTLSPMTCVESFEGSGDVRCIQIASNQLDVAYKVAGQSGMACLYLNHNFTDAAILSEGGFTVTLDVANIAGTTSDLSNRFAGFGLGMTQVEAAAAGDLTDNDTDSTTMRGGSDNAAVADFFVDTALDNKLRVWSNGAALTIVDVSSYIGTIKAEFIVTDFNAGSWVTAKVFFNNVLMTTQTFDWDNTAGNYIGISGRSVVPGTVVDNLTIQTGITATPTITVTQTNGGTSVKEDDYTDNLTLAITSNPLGYPVTINISDKLDPNQVTVTPSQVVFTSADWQSPQSVTITAIDDNDMEREAHETYLTFTTITDPLSPYYNYMLPNIIVNVHDNDCGTMGFDRADFNLDCQVDMEDFSYFAQEWVSCSIPDPECNNCGTWGFNLADFNVDCQVSLADFSAFALEWITCSLPDPGCQDFRY